ncbi:MAG: metallophosphoesterase [Nitrospirales bacterium]|nr:metallophosphoesterase [Nitrospirales bacterium]
MIIGIISDSHDHLDNLQKAVDLFKERKVEHIIHAGDFTSPFTWRVLKHFEGGFTGIFGNNDGERVLMRKLSSERVYTQPYKLTLAEKRIVVMHEPDVVDDLAASSHFDLIVFGHTHVPEIRRENNTLIVNPGELCGWVKRRATVAIADLQTMTAEIIDLV